MSHRVVNPHRRDTQEWAWVITHAAMHLGFGHLDADRSVDPAARAAACPAVTLFQLQMRIGLPPWHIQASLPGTEEQKLADYWRLSVVPEEWSFEADHVPGPSSLQRDDPVITDGQCDVVRIRREHAFLVPRGSRLPFRPVGEVYPIT